MGAILLIALAMRLLGVGWALPYVHHPDERKNLEVVHRMVVENDPNPRFFSYPSLFFDLQAVVHAGYAAAGKALGRFDEAGEVAMPRMQTGGNGVTGDSTVFVLARLVTVVLAVALVGVGMWLAWLLTRRRQVVLIAGALLAFHPMLVIHGRFATPDTLAGFTATAALAFAVVAARRRGVVAYAIAGAAIGLAAASKYNAVVVAVGLVAVHLHLHGRASLRYSWMLGIAGLAAVATFVIAVPFAVLDWHTFWTDATGEFEHYRTGHPGHEGSSLATNARWLWGTTGPVLVFAAVGAWEVVRRIRLALPVLLFTVVYFALVTAQAVRFDRNLVPLLPALLILAAVGVVAAASAVRLPSWALTFVAVAVVAWPAVLAMRDSAASLTNERAAARRWLEERVPPGARVMTENYSPYVDPIRFRVLPVAFAVLQAEVIERDQVDAVIVTNYGSGRWLWGQNQRPEAVETYSKLQASACDHMPARNGIEIFRLRC